MPTKEEGLAAFRAYDFDGSSEFKSHLRNIELPPGDDRALVKVKAKWFKRAVDPDFDINWVTESSSSRPAASSGPQQQQQQQQQQPRSTPAQQQQQPGAQQRSNHWQAGRKLHLGVLQALTLLFALLFLQPLAPRLSAWAYGKLMVVLLVAQGLALHTAHGLPAAWTLAGLKDWLARALSSPDGHYLLLAFMAAGNRPVAAVLPPFVIRAAYGLADAGKDLAGGTALWARLQGPRLHAALAARKAAAASLSAQSEIMLAFLLVLGLLLPGRAPLFAFMSWQFLRMRYWSTDGALYHRQVWALLDQKTAQLRQQFPILEKAVAFGVNFFNNQR